MSTTFRTPFHAAGVAVTAALAGVLAIAPSTSLAQDAKLDAPSALVGALLGKTPIEADVRELTDEIGGRPTGSTANAAAVEWALAKFSATGVGARKEAFTMPGRWLERSAEARISGDLSFDVAIAAMPFSIATPGDGLRAPIVDGGFGTEADFAALGDAARGAFVLIETPPLLDVAGLFREYNDNVAIERRAQESGAAGVVFLSSRPEGLLYRHMARGGFGNRQLVLAIERGDASRILRSLRAGRTLDLWARVALEDGAPHESWNVVAEIAGGDLAEEIVVIGAHLDSWGLGTGANDNGCNVAMMIDIARQMKRLGIRPRRTIRFALWNGEEQGMIGSWAYANSHADELDRHVMAGSVDIGSGRITGFFTGGRPDVAAAVDRALQPVAGLGPFEQVDIPVVGTDNFDFMIEGVANVVANQEDANYGPTYHATSDTFDKVDLRQLHLNAAIVATVVLEFANMDVTWTRQGREEIQTLIDGTDLGKDMRTFGMMDDWQAGRRGRR